MKNDYMKWLCEMNWLYGNICTKALYEIIMKMDKRNKYKYMEYNLC